MNDQALSHTKSTLKRRWPTLLLWFIVASFVFVTWGPDLRFGPDYRLSTKVIDPDKPGLRALSLRRSSIDPARLDIPFFEHGPIHREGSSIEPTAHQEFPALEDLSLYIKLTVLLQLPCVI